MAMDEKRNIVPLMMEGFDFGSQSVKEALSGKLATLNRYNGLRLVADYFFEAMEKLRGRYLNVALKDVPLKSVSEEIKRTNQAQKNFANEAAKVDIIQLTAEEWVERGYTFAVEAKNFEEAIRCFSESIRLDPNSVEAHYNLGHALQDLNRTDEAEAAYRKAIELNPSFATAYSSLIFLLRSTDRAEDALLLLDNLIEINPNNLDPYLALASISRQLGKTVSPELIEKARQFLPEDDFYSRACLESVCGNFNSAFEYLEKATEEGLDSDWAWQDPDLQWIRNDPRFEQIVGAKPQL